MFLEVFPLSKMSKHIILCRMHCQFVYIFMFLFCGMLARGFSTLSAHFSRDAATSAAGRTLRSLVDPSLVASIDEACRKEQLLWFLAPVFIVAPLTYNHGHLPLASKQILLACYNLGQYYSDRPQSGSNRQKYEACIILTIFLKICPWNICQK